MKFNIITDKNVSHLNYAVMIVSPRELLHILKISINDLCFDMAFEFYGQKVLIILESQYFKEEMIINHMDVVFGWMVYSKDYVIVSNIISYIGRTRNNKKFQREMKLLKLLDIK